jgi:hypothetical protein
MTDHRKPHKTVTRLLVAVTALSISFVSCKKDDTPLVEEVKPALKGVVLFTVGQVTLVKQDQSELALEMQVEVGAGDTVKTGARSFATVQFEDRGVVRIQENTTLFIGSLLNGGTSELLLKDGQVLTKINRLMKGEEFKIKTPTAVASVRGTEYSTTYRDGKSMVAVKKGQVAIAPLDPARDATGAAEEPVGDVVLVGEGKTAVVIQVEKKDAPAEIKVDTRAITPVESLTLEKVARVELVADPENKTKAELEQFQREVMKEEAAIDRELAPRVKDEKIMHLIEKKSNTLAEIKEVFERIDEISLYNGRMVQGAIISRGATYRVLTTAGAVDIKESDIKKVTVIK